MNSISGHIPEEEIRKFRELKESLWEIQQFGDGPLEEADALPLVCSHLEMSSENAAGKVTITEALDLPFEKFLQRVDQTLNFNGVHGRIIRALLVRVKSRKQIYPHRDATFSDLDCDLYRMQVYKSNDSDFLNIDDLKISPEVGTLYEIPKGSVISEENTGLNDNIHLLLYFKRQSGSEVLAKAEL